MGTYVRRLMLSLFAIAATAVAIPVAAGPAVARADGPCLNGHNWDDIHHVCV